MRGVKLWIVAAVAAVLIASGLYYGYQFFVRDEFQAALDQAVAQLPPGYSAKYASVGYSALSGHGSVTGLTIHKDGPEGFDLTIDRIDVDRPNLSFGEAWAQAAKNPAAVAPEMAIPLAGRITATGATLHGKVMTASVASVEVDGARLYPWSLLQPGVPTLPEVVAVMQALGQVRELSPTVAEPQAMQPLLRLMAAWMLATGYDQFTERDMSLAMTSVMPGRVEPVTSRASVRLTRGAHAVRGVMAEGTIEGYEISNSLGMKASLARASFSAVDMRKPLVALLARQTITPDLLDGLAIGSIAYNNVMVSGFGSSPISIGRFSVSKLSFTGAVPATASFVVSGVTLDPARWSMIRGRDAVARLGIDRLTISADLDYHWDMAQQTLAVPQFALKLGQLGSFDLSLDLDDIAPGSPVAALRARLRHAVLRYTDQSLVGRLIRAGAAQAQMDPDAYRQRLIETVEARVAPFPDSAALQAAARQIMIFLGDPKSLKIELAPPSPVPALALLRAGAMPPPQAVAALGIGVTANQ